MLLLECWVNSFCCLLAMGPMLNTLNKAVYVGYRGGSIRHLIPSSEITHPIIAASDEDREALLKFATPQTLRSLMADVPLATYWGWTLKKHEFLSGDSISLDQWYMPDAAEEWYHGANDIGFYLSAMERTYSLTHLQALSVPRHFRPSLILSSSQDSNFGVQELMEMNFCIIPKNKSS